MADDKIMSMINSLMLDDVGSLIASNSNQPTQQGSMASTEDTNTMCTLPVDSNMDSVVNGFRTPSQKSSYQTIGKEQVRFGQKLFGDDFSLLDYCKNGMLATDCTKMVRPGELFGCNDDSTLYCSLLSSGQDLRQEDKLMNMADFDSYSVDTQLTYEKLCSNNSNSSDDHLFKGWCGSSLNKTAADISNMYTLQRKQQLNLCDTLSTTSSKQLPLSPMSDSPLLYANEGTKAPGSTTSSSRSSSTGSGLLGSGSGFKDASTEVENLGTPTRGFSLAVGARVYQSADAHYSGHLAPPSPDSVVLSDEDRFESHCRTIANDITATVQLHMNGLHMRQECLLQQLEHIRRVYKEVIKKNSSNCCGKQPMPAIEFSKPDTALYKAISSLGFITTPAFAPFSQATGDGLKFVTPGANACFTIKTMNCFNEELLTGRECIQVKIFAIYGDLSTMGSLEALKVNLLRDEFMANVNKTLIPHTLFDHNNGKYTVTYNLPVRAKQAQHILIAVNINNIAICESPFIVPIHAQKIQYWNRKCVYGTEGNGSGQLCRPWGVSVVKVSKQLLDTLAVVTAECNEQVDRNSNTDATITNVCTGQSSSGSGEPKKMMQQHYLVAVADRSNNRIQLLGYDTHAANVKVLNVFGSGPGNRAGQFDRPAGICINLKLGHLIVADKDNHRIQVFDMNGRFLFKFGEKGNRVGQFCYPWDIDCCPTHHHIVVTDTRNRRLQLFTPYGKYITHFSVLLDSPRGVTFLPDKKLCVTDFNKHRLLIFDRFAVGREDGAGGYGQHAVSQPRIIGFGEGSAWGEFLRPQGLSACGNVIYCADSRNNRICMYNIVSQTFDYLGDEELALDRPSDLAVLDDQLMIVVDFGNNRLQFLHR